MLARGVEYSVQYSICTNHIIRNVYRARSSRYLPAHCHFRPIRQLYTIVFIASRIIFRAIEARAACSSLVYSFFSLSRWRRTVGRRARPTVIVVCFDLFQSSKFFEILTTTLFAAATKRGDESYITIVINHNAILAESFENAELLVEQSLRSLSTPGLVFISMARELPIRIFLREEDERIREK